MAKEHLEAGLTCCFALRGGSDGHLAVLLAWKLAILSIQGATDGGGGNSSSSASIAGSADGSSMSNVIGAITFGASGAKRGGGLGSVAAVAEEAGRRAASHFAFALECLVSGDNGRRPGSGSHGGGGDGGGGGGGSSGLPLLGTPECHARLCLDLAVAELQVNDKDA